MLAEMSTLGLPRGQKRRTDRPTRRAVGTGDAARSTTPDLSGSPTARVSVDHAGPEGVATPSLSDWPKGRSTDVRDEILIIAPPEIARAVERTLKQATFANTHVALDVTDALDRFASRTPVLVILSTRFADEDIERVAQWLRRESDEPPLLIGLDDATSVSAASDSVLALFDDSMVISTEIRTLASRVRAWLRTRALERDLSERLREALVTEDLSALLGSNDDAGAALEQAVRHVVRLPRVDFAALLVDGGERVLWAHTDSVYTEFIGRASADEIKQAVRTLASRARHWADPGEVTVLSRLELAPRARFAARRLGLQMIARASLELSGAAAGLLVVGRAHREPYTLRQIARLQDTSRHIAAMLDRLSLSNDLGRHVSQLKQLEDLLQLVSSSLDADPVLDAALGITQLLRVDGARIWLQDDERPVLRLVRAREPTSLGRKIDLESSLTGRAVRLGQPLQALRRPDRQHGAGIDQTRSRLVIPFRSEAGPSGALSIRTSGRRHFKPDEIELAQTLAQAVAAALRNAQLYQQARSHAGELRELNAREREARERAEAARQRMSFLAESCTILAASLDYEATLRAVARFAIPELGDFCLVFMYDQSGALKLVRPAHLDPEKEQLAARLASYAATQGFVQSHLANVMHTGQPLVIGGVQENGLQMALPDPQYLDAAHELGIRSAMIAPLVARGNRLGLIAFVAETPDRYSQEDILLAVELARRAALAIDNARLYQSAVDAERDLRYQLDFTATVTSSLGEGLVAVDRDLRVRHLNPAALRMLSVDSDDWYGQRAADLLPLADAIGQPLTPDQHPLAAAIQERTTLRVSDVLLRRPDGSSIPIACTVSPLIVDDHVTGVVCALHDNTASKRAEEADRQLRQSASLTAMGLLGSSVIHDLAQPLAAATAMLEVLADEECFTPHGQELAERIHRMLQRTGDLTLHVRRFLRGADGSVSDVNLAWVCDEALTLVEHDFYLRDIEVVRRFNPSAPLARGNADELDHVIVNLLANARDAMAGKTGQITISTDAALMENGRRAVALEIRDQGAGIPAQLRERVFEPLFTTKAQNDGAGLGLAICKRIIEHQGGTIRLDSTEGEGTCVRLLLPAADS